MPLYSPTISQGVLIGRTTFNLNTAAAQPFTVNASRYQLTGALWESCTGDPQLAEASLSSDAGGVNVLTSVYFPMEFPTVDSTLYYADNDFVTLASKTIQTAQTLYITMTVLEGTNDTCNLWLYGIPVP